MDNRPAKIEQGEQPLESWGLGNVNCELCRNTGQIIERTGPGIEITVRECSCMARRRALRQLANSNLAELQMLYTFKAYQTPTQEEEMIKNLAEQYCEAKARWFYISGKPGSGKTHICTAIFSFFMGKGTECYYAKWREEAGEIKSLKTSDSTKAELDAKMKKLSDVSLLYIDDFFKGKISEADKNLAFEILNARYNQPSKRTIISSELPLTEIIRIDEATGGRIRERAGGFILRSPAKDWRLHA